MHSIRRIAIFVVACIACIFLGACARQPYKLVKLPPDPVVRGVTAPDLIASNYKAVDLLVSNVQNLLPMDAPVIVSTVVDINAFEKSSTLGRVISEHVLGRLAQSGYGVIELKVRNQVYMKRNDGEFLLTREIRDLARSHNAQALVVGTYAEASDRIFVSLKMIEAEGSRVIGAVDYSVDKDSVVRSLLGRSD